MNDYSFDCESLGTDYDAPIIAIAVQQFDRNTGKMGATFSQEIIIESALRSGRISGETLQFWMMESDKARQLFAPSRDPERVSLATALDALSTWVRSKPGAPIVWGNGATADITWLQYAYRNGGHGLTVPWSFWNIRDMRTICDVAQSEKDDVPFVGIKHNALHDATHQAKVIAHCFAKLRGTAAKKTPKPQPIDDEDEL